MPQQPPHPDPAALPGTLRGNSHRFPYKVWLLALVFNGVYAILYLASPGHMTPGRGIAPWVAWGLIGLIVLPGPFFIWLGLFETVRFARYRSLRLEISPLPAATGSLIAGALDVPVSYDPAHRYAVRLQAMRYTRASAALGVNRLVHLEDFEARAAPGARGTRLRFALRVPAEAPPSEGYGETMRWTPATRERAYLRWTLRISARNKGVNFKEEFEIPVRRATAAEAAFAGTLPTAPSSPLPPMPSDLPSYESAQEGGRWVIRQPPWKNPGSPASDALWLMAFFGVFGLAGVGLIFLHHMAAYAVGGFFAAYGLLLAGSMLVSVASELRAEIWHGGLLITRTLWGRRLKHVVLGYARIASVEVVRSAPGGPPRWSVEVREHSGVLHCLAEFLVTAREAEALRDQVIARLGSVASAEAGNAARAAAAAAERQFQRPANVKKTAVVLGLMGLVAAYHLYPQWFSFEDSAKVPAQSVPEAAPPPPSAVDQALFLASRESGGTVVTGSGRSRARREERRDVVAQLAHLDTAIRASREENGEGHPIEAYVLNERARALRGAYNVVGAQASLDEAMRIMERHRPADAHRMLGRRAGEFDIERLASHGADILWNERRYADAHAYYLKAWEASLEVVVSDDERNFRRAHSSAGVMKTACVLGKWGLADQAMAELKERYKRVTPSAREGLKYWIESGEPRLKARKC